MKVKFNQFKTKLTRNSDSKGSNIMKKNRKLTALLVAACMTIPMAATTFTVPMVASGATVTIQNGENVSSNFYGYMIFKGIFSNGNTTGDTSDDTFSVTGWGDNFNYDYFISALKADDTLKSIFTSNFDDGLTTDQKAAKVAELASEFTSEDQEEAFARLAGANVKVNVNSSSTNHDDRYSLADIYGSGSGNIQMQMKSDNSYDITAGYYVIVEAYGPNGGPRTLGLLRVVGENLTINPKRSAPTISKTIVKSDNSECKVDDYSIGDTVAFKITGTLPERVDDYSAYYYVIEDELGTEFTAPTANNVTVKVGDNTITQANDKNCRVDVSNNKITVSFEDVTAYDDVTKDTLITVTYSAKLNQTAKIGEEGQTNSAKLTYLANPNIVYNPDTTDQNVEKPNEKDSGGYEPNTRTTAAAQVKVLTYELDIEKIDAQFNETKLNNAEFTLQNSENKFLAVQAIDSSNEHIYTVVGWVDSKDYSNDGATTTLTSKNSGKINIVGLDSGTYTLTETNAPTGYNILQEPITVIITAEKNEDISDPIDNTNDTQNLTVQVNGGTAVEGLKNENNYTGVLQIQVANNKGTTLPETGGIGTKIFYILGGTLVIGSGAALVIKKRMGKDEE